MKLIQADYEDLKGCIFLKNPFPPNIKHRQFWEGKKSISNTKPRFALGGIFDIRGMELTICQMDIQHCSKSQKTHLIYPETSCCFLGIRKRFWDHGDPFFGVFSNMARDSHIFSKIFHRQGQRQNRAAHRGRIGARNEGRGQSLKVQQMCR